MFCYSCGKEINDTAKFCKYCGTRMLSSGTPSAGADAPQQRGRTIRESTSAPRIVLPKTPTEAFDPEKVKKIVEPNCISDPRVSRILGIGYLLFIVLTFFPWVKAGMVSFSPYLYALHLFEQFNAGGGIGCLIIAAITTLLAIGIAAISAYGAYMCFTRSRATNIGNVAVAAACVLFLLVIFMSSFIFIGEIPDPLHGGNLGTYRFNFNPEFGLYATLAVSIVLTIVGSGRIDLRKYLGGKGSSGQ